MRMRHWIDCASRRLAVTALGVTCLALTAEAGDVTLDPGSFIKAEARSFWWGHIESTTKSNLRIPDAAEAFDSQSNGNTISFRNDCLTTFAVGPPVPRDPVVFEIGSSHAAETDGWLRSTARIRFQIDDRFSYDLSGALTQSGYVGTTGTGTETVRLISIETGFVHFSESRGINGNGTTSVASGAFQGSPDGILQPGPYELFVQTRTGYGSEGIQPGFNLHDGPAARRGTGLVTLRLTEALPPVITPKGVACDDEVALAAGETIAFTVGADDPDSFGRPSLDVVYERLEFDPTTGQPLDPPSYTPIVDLPGGATITPLATVPEQTKLQFSWTPGDRGGGNYRVSFVSEDHDGLQSTCEIFLIALGDRDEDGLLDKWERFGLDSDDDGSIDVDMEALGANWLRRDLFIYIDYMQNGEYDYRPSDAAIQSVVDAFKDAPVPNPVGEDGISLHVFVSPAPIAHRPAAGAVQRFIANLGTFDGEYKWERPTGFDGPEVFFDDIKKGLKDESEVEILRRHFPAEFSRFARYCLFAHRIADRTDSGVARGAPSSDCIVSLGAFMNESDPMPRRVAQILEAGTLMHEIGHLLGLNHGGKDKTNYKPGYLSVMNYAFQKTGLLVGGAARLDYSRFPAPPDPDQTRLDLDENTLDEDLGLGNWPDEMAGYQTAWFTLLVDDAGPVLDPFGEFQFETHWTAPFDPAGDNRVDWNKDGSATGIERVSVNRDLTNTPLGAYNDWVRISFTGGTVGAGAPPDLPPTSPAEELDLDTAKTITPAAPLGLAGRSARGSVRLSWIPSAPRGSVTYRLFRKESGAPGNPGQIATTSSTLHVDRSAERSKTYEYSLTVVDSLGAESNSSQILVILVR